MEFTIVIPVKDEGIQFLRILLDLKRYCSTASEIIVVVDDPRDETIQIINSNKGNLPIQVLENQGSPKSAATAIKTGLSKSRSNATIVFMGDGSDDSSLIPDLVRLIWRGVGIASASRYMPGGQQIGAPRLKAFLSKSAGKSFRLLTGVGTYDATNSFKAYSKEFLNSIEIESTKGFEVGLETVAKAVRLGYPVAELPTTWIERSQGSSNFKLVQWLPSYMKWYLIGIGVLTSNSLKRNTP